MPDSGVFCAGAGFIQECVQGVADGAVQHYQSQEDHQIGHDAGLMLPHMSGEPDTAGTGALPDLNQHPRDESRLEPLGRSQHDGHALAEEYHMQLQPQASTGGQPSMLSSSGEQEHIMESMLQHASPAMRHAELPIELQPPPPVVDTGLAATICEPTQGH